MSKKKSKLTFTEEKVGFKVGDKVKLKSGGSPMDVKQLNISIYGPYPAAICTWVEMLQPMEQEFPLSGLVKVE